MWSLDLAMPGGELPGVMLELAEELILADLPRRVIVGSAVISHCTPMPGAAAYQWHLADVECVKLLLARGAEANSRASNGLTPLMLAAAAPKGAECVKLLLAAGADAAAKDPEGRTAFDHAVSEGRPDAIRLLAKEKPEGPAGTVKE